MITHRLILNIGPFLAFHHGTMDVGNNLASGRNVMMNIGNDSAGACNVMTNVRNGYMRMYCKFSLDMYGQP